MNIPPKFDKILKNDQALDAMVKGIITDFEPILEDNKLFFFEEYTEHGIKHIEMVLKTAEFLIPDESFEYIKPEEIAIFILAVVFHDIGMHTYFSTFKAMLDGKYNDVRVDVFDNDKKTWQKLWDDYLLEARHWNSKQLNDIFGNSNEMAKEPDLSDKDKLTGRDKKLIGEFIRKNHARLAHEIALKGFIGEDTISFKNSKLYERYKELIGIVARSHGIKIRETFCYLKKIEQDAWQYPDGLNVIFLMILLRISDYLHIDKTRTNRFLLKVKALNSPVSLREHEMHLSIKHIYFGDLKEPELIYVTCNKPVDARMYVKIQTLIKDLQHELDLSWAVLGEIYGFNPEKKPKFKFRRIDSNLEALELDYIPQNITFKISNELSESLVTPLYSNNPSYGVRELVQNAVDACNERTLLDDTVDGEITVNVDTEKKTFEIIDNGIVMNEDVLINYFLVVGSSFRNSDVWKKRHINDDIKAKFARSGRFGIGALAAFLIGDKITVTTRHKDDELGYNFSYTMKPETLDIKRINAKIGTKIVIEMHEKSLNYFQINSYTDQDPFVGFPLWYYWYHFSTPQISYYLDGNQIGKNQFIIPDKGIYKDGWCDIPSKIFPNIKIKFIKKSIFKTDFEILVNGIIVSVGHYGASLFADAFKYKLQEYEHEYALETTPIVSIVDSNNILKINLARTKIYNFPENSLIIEEMFKYYLARLLSYPVNNIEELNSLSKTFSRRAIFRDNTDIKERKFTLCTPSFICNTKQKRVFLLYGNHKNIYNDKRLMNTPITILDDDSHLYFNDWPNMEFSKENNITRIITKIDCRNFWYDFSISNQKIQLDGKLKDDKRYKGAQPTFGLMLSNELELIVEYAPTIPTDFDENLMLKVLREYLPVDDANEGFIPFDMNKRKALYKKAFSDLKRYMDNKN